MSSKRQRRSVVHSEAIEDTPLAKQPAFQVVSAINEEQKNLIREINRNDIIIVTGVAGSGKTHISCGVAMEHLLRKSVRKVVLSRPQIAAEDAGFLPGDLQEKITPFLMPLYNELSYFCNVKKEINLGRIEIMPIAYCRGITFRDTFVIIDEFENMDYRQLKMILTRFGQGSKMILCGDISQSDLEGKSVKDCVKVIQRLRKLADEPENKIAIVELQTSVRHPIIEKIITALDT